MMTSVDLKCKQGEQWVTESAWISLLSSAILSIIHPGLYASARSAMRVIGTMEAFKEIAVKWPSVFHGVQAIANRVTPRHRDSNSLQEWYDILITMGTYGNSTMKLYNIGVELWYPAGTVIGVGGKVIEHGVEAFNGERVCLAYFMRENVFQRTGVKNEGWCTLDKIKELY
jgi:hypothetical protein